MAYKITSEKGKEIAKNLTTGSSYTASDGSVWTKQANGTVSVQHNGTTYNNAYSPATSNKLVIGKSSNSTTSPSTSSTSTGSSSSGSSSSTSSSSSSYSPYTNNGYTIGSDKGKSIAQTLPIYGTYEASDGSVWTKNADGTISVKHNGKTYDNAYTPTDYSTLIRQQIAAGVPYQDVQNAILARENKALNDASLSKYAYDDVYNMAWNYILEQQEKENYKNAQKDAERYMNDYMSDNPQPDAPETDPRIEKLLNAILNREDFSYDAMSDPLYQQYREMYQREGDRAMRDTLAEVAASAGGMNTYAVTAAQQANNYYNSQLNDMIPQLYQLAYDMYLDDKQSMVQDLGLLQDMDATQYARYRDTMNDWYNDKQFAYGMYTDALNQGNWQTNFDYNVQQANKEFSYNDYWKNKEFDYNDYWNNKQFDYNDYWKNKEFNYNDYWNNKEFDYNAGRDQIADSRYDDTTAYEREKYEQETAYNQVLDLIGNGVTTIDPALMEKAGLSQDAVNQMVTFFQTQYGVTPTSGGGSGGGGGSRSSGGGGSSSSYGYTGSSSGDDWTEVVIEAGLPQVLSPKAVANLHASGAIYEDSNGKTTVNPAFAGKSVTQILDDYEKVKQGQLPGLSRLF